MALVVFLRGVNVGGHRTFRPSVLATQLKAFDVVNVGAAGTFVVRKAKSRTKFRTALLKKLPFDTEVFFCDSRDFIRLNKENPFRTQPHGPKVVHFVTILAKASGTRGTVPTNLPPKGPWFVKIIGSKGCFVFGIYRRHMKTIRYLGQIDKLFSTSSTTRNWNTINAVFRILETKS